MVVVGLGGHQYRAELLALSFQGLLLLSRQWL
jgi:hypothetical protein